MIHRSFLRNRSVLAVLVTVGALAGGSSTALAETKQVTISQQFGISYLPLIVMKNQQLLEKQAKEDGLGDVTVSWAQMGGGSATNEALLSGNVHFATGGVAPMLTIWDKTKGTRMEVKGVAALNSMPLYLNTINPNVKTVKDFTPQDRIALPAVKVSIQAVTLQMAAEQAFGKGSADKLDPLTVSMKHPDGMTAMMSGKSEITAHFTSAPYSYQELEDPRVHRVLSSYDVLGGPGTFNVVWAADKFRQDNPKTMQSFVGALEDAMGFIKSNPRQAAEIYIQEEKSNLPVDFVEKIIRDPENVFTTEPQNIMKYASFMNETGAIKNKPKNWQEMFFDNIQAGS
ncbi:MAG TPA: ABC transporter substrate-binding protein [Azospirillaceae bacterium]|nr:ABC transporter substrate-binding protein [Azospirillaceae bacterium]